MSRERRKELVEPGDPGLSITKQCELLQISRSSWYYEATGESELNLKLMRLIDEQFLEAPYYGARQMARYLRRQGYWVNRKRVRRLMQKMGLMAIYQKPNTSKPHPEHKIYPYLLQRDRHTGAQPGLVLRRDVHTDEKGLSVSGGGHGLAQSEGSQLEAQQYP